MGVFTRPQPFNGFPDKSAYLVQVPGIAGRRANGYLPTDTWSLLSGACGTADSEPYHVAEPDRRRCPDSQRRRLTKGPADPMVGRSGQALSYRSVRSGGRSARTGTGWRDVRAASPWHFPLSDPHSPGSVSIGITNLTYITIWHEGSSPCPGPGWPRPVAARAWERRPAPVCGHVPCSARAVRAKEQEPAR